MEGDDARGKASSEKCGSQRTSSGMDTLLLEGLEASRALKPERDSHTVNVHIWKQSWCSEYTVLHQTGGGKTGKALPVLMGVRK